MADIIYGAAGINFAAHGQTSASGASMSSEELDDYEEGTWTPAMVGAAGSNEGNYTKIGRLVYINGNTWSIGNTNGGSDITIAGLPFACSGNSAFAVGYLYFVNHPSGYTVLTLRTNNTNSSIVVEWTGDDKTTLTAVGTDFDNGSAQLIWGGTYNS